MAIRLNQVYGALAPLTEGNFQFGLNYGSGLGVSSGQLVNTGIISAFAGNGIFVSGTVPFTITNSTSTDTSAPFQQMVVVNPSLYTSYLASDLSNVQWFDANGNVINSWLESGNSNTATQAVYWLSLANGIGANSSITVYMGIASTTTNLLNNTTTGEAPQLSSTYGEYDNGINVFDFYDNFAGTTLSSVWTVPSNSKYTVNNGFIAAPSAQDVYAIYNNSVRETSLIIAEWGLNMSSTSYPNNDSYFQLNRYTLNSNMHWLGVSGSDTFINNNSAITTVAISSTGTQVFGIWNDGTTVTWYYEGNSHTDTSATAETDYLALGWASNGQLHTFPTTYWVRARIYPSNGVMPTVSVGSLNTGGVLIMGKT